MDPVQGPKLKNHAFSLYLPKSQMARPCWRAGSARPPRPDPRPSRSRPSPSSYGRSARTSTSVMTCKKERTLVWKVNKSLKYINKRQIISEAMAASDWMNFEGRKLIGWSFPRAQSNWLAGLYSHDAIWLTEWFSQDAIWLLDSAQSQYGILEISCYPREEHNNITSLPHWNWQTLVCLPSSPRFPRAFFHLLLSFSLRSSFNTRQKKD